MSDARLFFEMHLTTYARLFFEMHLTTYDRLFFEMHLPTCFYSGHFSEIK